MCFAHHRHRSDAGSGRRGGHRGVQTASRCLRQPGRCCRPSSPSSLPSSAKEAYSSLFIGVVVGALFTTNFAPVAAPLTRLSTAALIARNCRQRGYFHSSLSCWASLSLWSTPRAARLLLAAGQRRTSRPTPARSFNVHLRHSIFIDDYFNFLTVEITVMRPVTKQPKISTEADLPHRRDRGSCVHDRAHLS